MFCFGISSTQQLTSWADTSLRLLQLKSSMTAITNCDKHEVVAEWPIGLRRRFGANLSSNPSIGKSFCFHPKYDVSNGAKVQSSKKASIIDWS